MLETGWEDLGAPADSIPQTGLGASVTLLPPRGMLTLRGDLNSPEFSSALDTITGTAVALAVDVSDARVIYRVSGEKASRVLAKGAPVDFDKFNVGEVRRTRMGLFAAAFLKISQEPESYEVFCSRSYARYVSDWLQTAALEDSLSDL